MKKKISFNVSLVFSLLILTLPIAVIIYHKSNGHLINGWEITGCISLFAFPLSMVFVLIKKVPGMVKVIVSLVILCGTAFLCVWMNGVGGYVVFESYNGIEQVERYNEQFGGYYSVRSEDIHKIDVPIESYGEFEDISHYYYLCTGIFQDACNTTIVEYTDEEFENEVKRLNSENTFYEKAVLPEDPVPVFTFEGFDFRLKKPQNEDDYDYYPKCMNFIGVNNATNEIAYVHFENWDLDGVFDFETLMYSYCGWRYITEERTEK